MYTQTSDYGGTSDDEWQRVTTNDFWHKYAMSTEFFIEIQEKYGPFFPAGERSQNEDAQCKLYKIQAFWD